MNNRKNEDKMKKLIKKILESKGYALNKVNAYHKNGGVELSQKDIELVSLVRENRYSSGGIPRLVNTLKACQYAVLNNIPGDFVECGVWRGGHGIIAKKTFEELKCDKRVWMFDTFSGMTVPSKFDVKANTQKRADQHFSTKQREWASLEDVKKNCSDTGLDLSGVNFVLGDVAETLNIEKNLPKKISVLRLDTDYYESTKLELELLYPRLSLGGVLIIDDYGAWEGARKAVDEYFETKSYKPLFNVIDHTGRSALKHSDK